MPRKSNYRPRTRDEDPLYRFLDLRDAEHNDDPDVAFISIDGMTEQQLRVFALLSEGISNKQIARRLNITESTVKVYVSAILQFLGCANRTQAALAALRYLYDLPAPKQARPQSVRTQIDKETLLSAS